ncbi:MAG: hypothetical protein MK033_07595 [Candidatus Caenarcaniphilales bacterium]|nr:hypothetical protein [Candidatus Caenarcaniphilales bacterium]
MAVGNCPPPLTQKFGFNNNRVPKKPNWVQQKLRNWTTKRSETPNQRDIREANKRIYSRVDHKPEKKFDTKKETNLIHLIKSDKGKININGENIGLVDIINRFNQNTENLGNLRKISQSLSAITRYTESDFGEIFDTAQQEFTQNNHFRHILQGLNELEVIKSNENDQKILESLVSEYLEKGLDYSHINEIGRLILNTEDRLKNKIDQNILKTKLEKIGKHLVENHNQDPKLVSKTIERYTRIDLYPKLKSINPVQKSNPLKRKIAAALAGASMLSSGMTIFPGSVNTPGLEHSFTNPSHQLIQDFVQ